MAHNENLREVLALANAAKQPFLIYLVPRRTASIEIYQFASAPLIVMIGNQIIA
ncbi:hypothetical protein [Nostoc sp.]|uniref:hypothetical protein n=1 Tax=Nostoc sp. TaxID=1180 RepID=UPI002FF73901